MPGTEPEILDPPPPAASSPAPESTATGRLSPFQVAKLERMLRWAEEATPEPVEALRRIIELAELALARLVELGPGPEPGPLAPAPSPRSHPDQRPFLGFDRERELYRRKKPELLAQDEGRYVVIVGEEMIGPFGSDREAERAGYERFGLGPLYIRQILAVEPFAVIPFLFAL